MMEWGTLEIKRKPRVKSSVTQPQDGSPAVHMDPIWMTLPL